MLRFSAILWICVLVALGEMPGRAQETSCLHRLVPVTVEDARGVAISGLSAADFQGKSHVGPMKILSVVQQQGPRRLVILIDASGSMAAQRRRVGMLASALAETPFANTKIALIVYRSRVDEEMGFAQPQGAIVERLRGIAAGTPAPLGFYGKTALYDSLERGLKLLSPASPGDSLYLISDGIDDTSHAKLDEVAHDLAASGVRLYVALMLASIVHRLPTMQDSIGLRNMQDLARRTGGEVIVPYGAQTADQMSEATHLLAQRVAHDYLLEMELPASMRKPSGWELKLSSEDRKRWKDAQVIYPAELTPCTP